jgi:ribosome-binding protein aMBF1 (putative translation factor)
MGRRYESPARSRTGPAPAETGRRSGTPRSIALKFDEVPPDKAFRLSIAREIARARVQKNMTQEQLAELAGTRQSRISELENLQGDPQIGTVQQVAHALGLELRLIPARKTPNRRPRK